ncbi:hypothetical protein [Pseudolactococcus carnosus]|nr:hypothetical protein [Lactococcus carnosus]MCJ2002888.1 hypothetical protein [Lactococcus carnosus]
MINISNRIWIEKKVETLKAKYTITSMAFVKIRNDDTEDELEFTPQLRSKKIKHWHDNLDVSCFLCLTKRGTVYLK